MHNFSDFNIPRRKTDDFTGEKIPVKKLLNQSIKVLGFKIEPSKLKEGTKCLVLQIEKGGDKRIVFTGAKGLLDQILRVPSDKLPFETVIKEENERYEFT